MTTKWTPGPWITVAELAQRVDDGRIFGGGSMVAMTQGAGFLTLEQILANGKLIAAAPDLYEALQDVLDHIVVDESKMQSGDKSVLADARAALAKARGEQTTGESSKGMRPMGRAGTSKR